jgi:hypothetical protein
MRGAILSREMLGRLIPILLPLPVSAVQPQGGHAFSVLRRPPSAWAFETLLHDVAMRTLDFARADARSASTRRFAGVRSRPAAARMPLPSRQRCSVRGVIPATAQARYLWVMLLARLFESMPLVCPNCGAKMRPIVFITETAPIKRMVGTSASLVGFFAPFSR